MINQIGKGMNTAFKWFHNWPIRYGFAVVLVAIATWLYQQLSEATGTSLPLFICYYPAIIIAAVIGGGFGSGLFTTLLSVACADYFFVSPAGQFTIDNEADAIGMAVFLFMGLGISLLAESVNRVRKQSEAELRQANAYNRSLIEISLDPLVTISPEGKITDVNAAMEEATGWSRDKLIGTDVENYFTDPMAARAGYQQVFRNGLVRDYALEIRHRDGHVTPVLYNAAVYRDDTGRVAGIFAAARDITNIKQAEEYINALHLAKAQLQELAHHDPLTHLPNRRLLDDRLHQAIAQNLRTDRMIAICYLDLDGFKPVNDQLGHEVGDQLLIEVASRLLSIVRAGDTVARIGGDEFVLLLSELTSLEECKQILARLLDVITAPYSNCDAQQFKISASIGVTLFPQDTADQDTLLRHADQAMYTAKQNGRNCYRLFDLLLERQLADKREMLERIRQGLASNEFCLYFQPQVDFDRKALVGTEALIRWQHPTMGLLEPAEFLPAVENDDLALVMGNWVIREALRQMQIWRREGINLQVSINTFARQLCKPDFVASLQQILSEYPDVPPSQLQIEITETTILPELPVVQQIITDCQQLGVGFSVDDFGTGYSSLIYLRHLSAMELKIDQSFVRDMLTNHEDQDIIEGIIALGRSFHRSVIAEGVETTEQIHRLLELGCEAMQGYGIARPMPSEQIVTWVRDFQPAQLLS
jgi:diguanylate cyclase (GGDEF)-like protein/PAS domain S-box-containing protein